MYATQPRNKFLACLHSNFRIYFLSHRTLVMISLISSCIPSSDLGYHVFDATMLRIEAELPPMIVCYIVNVMIEFFRYQIQLKLIRGSVLFIVQFTVPTTCIISIIFLKRMMSTIGGSVLW